ADADVLLDSQLVSRRHALIWVREHGFVIEDLGSRNGVRVNDEPVLAPRLLAPGDVIRIADETLVFVETDEQLAQRVPTISDVRILGDADRTADFTPRIPSFTDEDESIATRRADAFLLLATVVDKALALGRGEEAEHLIG